MKMSRFIAKDIYTDDSFAYDIVFRLSNPQRSTQALLRGYITITEGTAQTLQLCTFY
jgi:hypothetical protein